MIFLIYFGPRRLLKSILWADILLRLKRLRFVVKERQCIIFLHFAAISLSQFLQSCLVSFSPIWLSGSIVFPLAFIESQWWDLSDFHLFSLQNIFFLQRREKKKNVRNCKLFSNCPWQTLSWDVYMLKMLLGRTTNLRVNWNKPWRWFKWWRVIPPQSMSFVRDHGPKITLTVVGLINTTLKNGANAAL